MFHNIDLESRSYINVSAHIVTWTVKEGISQAYEYLKEIFVHLSCNKKLEYLLSEIY